MIYTCDICQEECESDESRWTEEDAMKEALELFPDYDLTREEDRSITCEDCHAKILDWMKKGCPGVC